LLTKNLEVGSLVLPRLASDRSSDDYPSMPDVALSVPTLHI